MATFIDISIVKALAFNKYCQRSLISIAWSQVQLKMYSYSKISLMFLLQDLAVIFFLTKIKKKIKSTMIYYS